MIKIRSNIFIDESEVHFTFICSPGPGGQNVNKVATTALLRFNVTNCPTLPEVVKSRLTVLAGKKITLKGDLVIKASRFRTQERNKHDALNRLISLIQCATVTPKKRQSTKPTFSSIQRRLNTKKQHGKTKLLRRQRPDEE